MSKTHRRSDSPASVPFHFFRVILQPSKQRQKLRLPSKFVKKFGKELSNVAVLSVPTGRVWHVGLEKVDKRIWFVQDWQAFAEYYSLCYGDFLEFRYEGKSKFRVLIFDTTCSEIAYPSTGRSSNQQKNSDMDSLGIHEEDMGDDHVTDILVTTTPLSHASIKGKRKCVDEQVRVTDILVTTTPLSHASIKGKRKCVDEQVRGRRQVLHSGVNLECQRGATTKECMECQSADEMGRKKSRYEDEGDKIDSSSVTKSVQASLKKNDDKEVFSRNKSIENMKVIQATNMVRPKHPFFSIILQPDNFRMYYLHVPTEFAEKYLNGCSGSIKLQDSNAKHWDVRFVCVNPSLQIMCKGCSQFFTDNNLEVGDVCLFEMMKRKGGVVLKVSLLCAAEYADIIDSRNVKKSTQTCGSQDLSTRQSEDEEMFAFDLLSYTYPEWQLQFPNELEKVAYATRMFKLKNPFFAVILQLNNYHLSVPVDFAGKYLSRCSEFIKLQDSNGDQWDVQCTYTNASSSVLRFGRGYNEFLAHKNLEQGDVCLFELIKRKDIVLKVSVLSASQYEVLHDKGKNVDESRNRRYSYEDEEDVTTELVGRLNETGKSPSHKLSADHQENTENCNSGTLYYSFKIEKMKMSKESRRAFNAAKKFKTENPAFLVILRHYHMKESFVAVPAEFDSKHLGDECSAFITLAASNEKQWRVRFIYGSDRKRISEGWGAFSMENNLDEGDVCVFELIASKNVVLKASIFRAAQYAD